MSLEVSIPKEITEYKEKIAFGLSIRQLASASAAIAVGAPTFYLLSKLFDFNVASTVVMFVVAPIFALGFVEIRGYRIEKYLEIVYKHRFMPQRRLYAQRNLILAFYTNQEESEQTNAVFLKGRRNVSGRQEANLTVAVSEKRRKEIRKLVKFEIKQAKKDRRIAKKRVKRDPAA